MRRGIRSRKRSRSAAALIGAARVEVDAANLGVNLAQEAVTQAQDRFRAGVANNIEVISAQDQLARANDNQISALVSLQPVARRPRARHGSDGSALRKVTERQNLTGD